MPEVTLAQIDDKIKQVGVQLEENRQTILDEAGKQAQELVSTSHADVRADLQEENARLREDITKLIEERQTIEMAEKANEAILARMDEFTTRLEMAMSGDGAAQPRRLSQTEQLHMQAFMHYSRTGVMGGEPEREWLGSLDEIQRRAITEGTADAGGFLVPDGMRLDIIKNILELDPISQLARRVEITEGNSYTVPRMSDTGRGAAGQNVSETGSGTGKKPKWEMVTRVVHPVVVPTEQISQDFLSDVRNAGEILADWAGEELAYKVNYNYLLGDGAAKAEGILQNATVVAATLTGTDTTDHRITGEDFYYALSGLKEKYQQRAVFLFCRTTLSHAMTLREDRTADGGGTDSGGFILPFSLRDGYPPTIAGLKYYLSPNMPADGTKGNKMLLCGDLKAGYYFARKDGIYFIADPYSHKPNWEYLWRMRDDGVVVKPEALQIVTAG